MGPARKVTLKEVRRRTFEICGCYLYTTKSGAGPFVKHRCTKVLDTKTDVDLWSVAAPCI